MKILFLNSAAFLSGAEISMLELLEGLSKSNLEIFIALPKNASYQQLIPNKIKCIKMPLIWFVKSANPLHYIKYILNFFIISFELFYLIKKEKIQVIYSNTSKAFVYVPILKFFIPNCKYICHIRDNIRSKFFNNIISRHCDKIVCISEYIFKQIYADNEKKFLVYGGVEKRSADIEICNKIRSQLELDKETRLIAQIGQLTRWKNHADFIKSAEIIKRSYTNTHFLIIGDDLSGRENKYKQELIRLIEQLNMGSHISFLGYLSDIKELISQIDILIHPAINEPFGRVIIETMAEEKPVIAYDCGGPKEIIQNNKTGFLVDPYDFKEIAKKTLMLLNNNTLRKEFGKEGRKHVLENYDIKTYIKKMNFIFDNL